MVKNTIFLVNLGTESAHYGFKIEETAFSTAESKFDSMFF